MAAPTRKAGSIIQVRSWRGGARAAVSGVQRTAPNGLGPAGNCSKPWIVYGLSGALLHLATSPLGAYKWA
eukprot:11505325-Alexandrium_andersonii.AAC.1